jgi:hypothetical protein
MVKLVREWPSRRLMNQSKEVDQARALTIELAAEVGLVLLQVLDHSARNSRKEEARQRNGEATQRRTAPSRRTISMAIAGSTKSTQHPIAAPVFRCLPDRVSGIPSCRDSLPFAADNPTALFHEKGPGIPPLLFATLDYRLGQGFGLEWWLFMTVKAGHRWSLSTASLFCATIGL